jgi:hypothetical protein
MKTPWQMNAICDTIEERGYLWDHWWKLVVCRISNSTISMSMFWFWKWNSGCWELIFCVFKQRHWLPLFWTIFSGKFIWQQSWRGRLRCLLKQRAGVPAVHYKRSGFSRNVTHCMSRHFTNSFLCMCLWELGTGKLCIIDSLTTAVTMSYKLARNSDAESHLFLSASNLASSRKF